MPRRTEIRPNGLAETQPFPLIEPILCNRTGNDPWRSVFTEETRPLEANWLTDQPTISNQPYRYDTLVEDTDIQASNIGYDLSHLAVEVAQYNHPPNVDIRCIVRPDRKHGIESVKTE